VWLVTSAFAPFSICWVPFLAYNLNDNILALPVLREHHCQYLVLGTSPKQALLARSISCFNPVYADRRECTIGLTAVFHGATPPVDHGTAFRARYIPLVKPVVSATVPGAPRAECAIRRSALAAYPYLLVQFHWTDFASSTLLSVLFIPLLSSRMPTSFTLRGPALAGVVVDWIFVPAAAAPPVMGTEYALVKGSFCLAVFSCVVLSAASVRRPVVPVLAFGALPTRYGIGLESQHL
jgi:hypothetical protein